MFPVEPWTELDLLHALDEGPTDCLVVASTVRAARGLRRNYVQWKQSQGSAGWTTPNVLDWQTWLESLWDSATMCGVETRLLLKEAQELFLWRRILEQDEAANSTTTITALAPMAMQALEALDHYQVPLGKLRGDNHTDARAFLGWANRMRQVSKKHSLLPASELESAVANICTRQEIQLPRQILLVGLDRITPSQRQLIETLQSRGCPVRILQLITASSASTQTGIVYAPTQQEEIAAAAHWCSRELAANPEQRIGIIVPGLEELRDRIDSAFQRILVPSSLDVNAAGVEPPYEFSLGTPMHRLQPIRTALLLLEWLQRSLAVEEVTWLIVLGGFSARTPDARARLDRKFREQWSKLGGAVPLSTYQAWMRSRIQSGTPSRSPADSAPVVRAIGALAALAQRRGLDRERTFAEWREVIEELLSNVEWHLLQARDSADYQLLQRWNSVLDQLSSLNAVAGNVSLGGMLTQLREMVSGTLFSHQSTDAPIQIMGVPESAGLLFDSVWLMNARSSAWPTRGRAMPLLPWSVQCEARMPYVSHAEDYAFARGVTERILSSAGNAVASFALQENDPATSGTRVPTLEVLLSPLIQECWRSTPIIAAENYLPELSASRPTREVAALESVEEEDAVQWQGERIGGGVRFLELQAACPFRAFAELRLASNPFADSGAGLSPSQQGTILHAALHAYWREVGSLANLNRSSEIEGLEILRRHIAAALQGLLKLTNKSWQRELLRVEALRMEERLLLWLQQEKLRPAFTVVATEAELKDQTLGGIRFNCRIDRVDQVDRGLALIDYKAGPISSRECEGERPDQPQLPAYAVLQTGIASSELAGLAFASLHPRNMGFEVVRSLPSIFSRDLEGDSSAPDNSGATQKQSKRDASASTSLEMAAQLSEWRATLTRLAESFHQGAAIVDPKRGNQTCSRCGQSIFCRIQETSAGDVAQEEQDESRGEYAE